MAAAVWSSWPSKASAAETPMLAATGAFGLAGLAGFAVLCFTAGAVTHVALARARAHAIVGGA